VLKEMPEEVLEILLNDEVQELINDCQDAQSFSLISIMLNKLQQ
jgi:hypothetical protein